EHKCRKRMDNCLYEKSELDKVSLIQSDLRRKPCPKVRKPDYTIIKKKPTVNNIDLWVQNANHTLIKVVSQGEKDFYARTLEEAMLCKLLGITVESLNSPTWWKSQVSANKLHLEVPNKRKDITVRDIINANKSNKIDFMYSVILADLHIKLLPNYIKNGLEWLAEKEG
ncbi:hypothetical protein, partial [Methanosarcina mazei]|uniref:hypothetical protein n=1 Tax=Methanosarcina mazei TaxID=2209 RepID=UPI00064F20F7